MTIAKTFLKAFTLATVDAKKVKNYFSDRRLSNAEKKILEGYLRLRSSEFQWIEENLSSLVSPDSVVNGVCQLVLGIARNNAGKPNEAIPFLQKALVILRESGQQIIHFLAVYNLFVANQNLSSLDKLKELHQEALKFKFPNGSAHSIRQLRLQFNYFSITGFDKAAFKILAELEKTEESLDEFQRLAWVIDKIRFYASRERYEMCLPELEKLKSMRSYYLTEDYKFIKATLGYLSKNSPLYLYGRDFTEIPSLRLQVEVLLSLEGHDYIKASTAWSELQVMAPNVYLDDFKYKGEVCLFSLCLDKFLRAQKSQQTIELKGLQLSTKEEKLFQLLQQNPNGIPKSLLYQQIWGQVPEGKSEVKKLSKLLERVKLKYGVEVQSRKGTYVLNPKQKAKEIA